MDHVVTADSDLIIWIVIVGASLIGQGVKNYREAAARRRKLQDLADARASGDGQTQSVEYATPRPITPPVAGEAPLNDLETFLKSLANPTHRTETLEEEEIEEDEPAQPVRPAPQRPLQPPPHRRPDLRADQPLSSGRITSRLKLTPTLVRRMPDAAVRPSAAGATIKPLSESLDPYAAYTEAHQPANLERSAMVLAVRTDLKTSKALRKAFLLREVIGKPVALQKPGSDPLGRG